MRRPPGPWLSTKNGKGGIRAAAKLLETMLERGDDPVFAYEALAKLYEHQFRNPEQALHYVRQALLLLAEPKIHKDETGTRNAK